jgi:hypothetical protein
MSALISKLAFVAQDTVGEFPKQRTYAFRPTEFKELTQLRLNSPTVSCATKAVRLRWRGVIICRSLPYRLLSTLNEYLRYVL